MDKDKVFIEDLTGYSFSIPDYQRGYRWTKQEVREFLDDISEFDANSNYCIQTLMVIEDPNNEKICEVVDGQQRLTTIFIILSMQMNKGFPLTVPYSLKYETRSDSETFLKNLKDPSIYDGTLKDDNIDYYHITMAYQAVEDWLNDYSNEDNKKKLKLLEICSKILEKVFFIYYSVPNSEKAKEVFRKVNLGKIPLSNAELIKAIIFNEDNFKSEDNSGSNVEKEQQELSLEWNRLERELENESFWWFIVRDEKESSNYVTRIDYLFDLVMLRKGNKSSGSKMSYSEEQKQYVTFSYFFEEYKKCKNSKEKKDYISKLWNDVNETFELLREWYGNLNLYHIAGYLICAGVPLKDLIKESTDKKKSEIYQIFMNKIKERKPINLILQTKPNNETDVDVSQVDYSWSKNDLRLLFLFINIATLICKNNKQYRFPFDLLKKEHWDIEHIHATADESDLADNELKNLTLLDWHTNREFQDDTFDLKRKHVIKKDREGRFIPICTKNVYLKEYTNDIANTNMEMWDDADKKDYIEAIQTIIKEFFEGHFEFGDFIKKEEGQNQNGK